MTWFVAGLISVIEVLDCEQSEYPVEEEFYLFEAHSTEELNKKVNAEIEMINLAGQDGIRYYGKKAKQYCIGVRKIKSIFNSADGLDIDEDPPTDGTSLIDSYMTVKSLEDAKLLAEGKAVHVHYIDDDPLDK